MKNIITVLSFSLVCFCSSFGQELQRGTDLEPLDHANWGKNEKFAQRERNLENLTLLLATVHKIKKFSKANTTKGVTKEVFKTTFLQSKSALPEHKSLVNEMKFVANKFQKEAKNVKIGIPITKASVFNTMLDLAYDPNADNLAEISYKALSNKVPVPTPSQALSTLRRSNPTVCKWIYRGCLADFAGAIHLDINLLAGSALVYVGLVNPTPVSLAVFGISITAAITAAVIRQSTGYYKCKFEAEKKGCTI